MKVKLMLITLCIGMQSYSMESKKHIVVEPLFFIEHNPTAVTKHLSWKSVFNLSCSLLGSTFGGTLDKVPDFFNTLHTIKSQSTPHDIIWENHKAPYHIFEHLTAQRPHEEILKEVTNGIDEKKLNDSQLMKDLAKITFDPEANANIMQTISASIALLNELKQKGHTLHLVGNWNDKAADKLQTKFQQDFALFESIVLSGREQKIGPELYTTFVEKNNAKPQDVIFINTSQEIPTFLPQEYQSAPSILCEKKEITPVRQKLIELKVLSQ